MKTTKVILFFIFLYLLSTGASFAIFTNLNKEKTDLQSPVAEQQTKTSKKKFKIDPSIPRDQECPLNGVMYTKQEKDAWEKRRPMGIMIENHADARPQSGISSADVVYEAIAEGGITRFLSVFYCQDTDTVGPIRSARVYFIDMIAEYGDHPLYVHIGGANCNEETGSGCENGAQADAQGQLSRIGWRGPMGNDMDGIANLSYPTIWHDAERQGREVAWEHTSYSSTDKLWKEGARRGFTNVDKKDTSWDKEFVKWKFKDDLTSDKRGTTSAEFAFWPGVANYSQSYSVGWKYDLQTNSYLRENGGKSFTDRNDDSQISAKNVVLAFMTEKRANDGYENNQHLLYGTKGTGKAILLQDGKAIEGIWKKAGRFERIKFQNTKGEEISFNRGQIWVEIIPIGTEVKM